MTEPSDGPTCERCGGDLKRPMEGAQFECDECGMVVAPDQLRDSGGRHV